MRNWTEHGSSRLTAISDAGSTPAASTILVFAKLKVFRPETQNIFGRSFGNLNALVIAERTFQ
jgi:hypothetical protein